MDKNREKLIKYILNRGVVNIIPSKEKLEKELLGDRKLNIYLGIDPTATRIHLGHAFPLRRLAWFVELGHNVTFLIGDFTALIGDTSDKDKERPVLTYEQIKENFASYKKQAEKFLDFSKVKVVHNSEWLSKLGFDDVVKLARHFTLNDFISRELIKKRLTEGTSVSLPEVLYPMMQGYDSYFMDTDIQIGGTDQTFNMQAGRTLQKDFRNKESFIIANGFLTGTDGRKMSKSWGNAIWLEDSAEEIFGKVMSVKDELLGEYFNLATNLSDEEVSANLELIKSGENPMKVKRILARQIVKEIVGEDKIQEAEKSFDDKVVNKTAGEDVLEIKVVSSLLGIDQLSVLALENKLIESKSEFRRLLEQGGIYLNDQRIDKDQSELRLKQGENLLRLGKRKYLKIIPN